MSFELQARTDSGRRLVALAERLAADFATRAADHDRDRSYPHEDVVALRETRYLAAPVPEELGGLGVESVHDLLVAQSRLARGDASVAIGVSMHLIPLANVAQRWRMTRAAGDAVRADAYARFMERVTRGGVVMASAVSEPGQDLTRPSTRARRAGDGWSVSGRKIFCTMAPAADVLYTAITVEGEDGERYAYAAIPADSPGVRVHDDWDALGMRASGSHSVTFEDVRLPEEALRGGFATGRFGAEYVARYLVAGAFHAAASVGIAEEALRIAVEGVRARLGGDAPRPHQQMLVAEAAVELMAIRATLARAGGLLDEHHLAGPAAERDEAAMVALFAEVQAGKAFVSEAAVRVVDRALTLSGGAGYMSRHPLSRAYRDVRAGAFMHPLGANRAYELIGELELGREPSLH